MTTAAPLVAPPDEAVPAQHVLIITQSLVTSPDRRVLQECRALVAANYRVSVICPRGPDEPPEQWWDGIHLYKFRRPPKANSPVGAIAALSYIWLRTACLSMTVWRRHRFTAIQACNPPDIHWLLAWLWRRRQVSYVLDQYGPTRPRFQSGSQATDADARSEPAGLPWRERMGYQVADRVISADESLRELAIEHGRLAPADVTIVRSEPDPNTMRPIYPTHSHRRSRYCLGYVGTMGVQDNVDVIIDVMADLVHRRGRRDVSITLIGSGECLGDLRRRTTELGLDDYVTFTGRADRSMLAECLSIADIGLDPTMTPRPREASMLSRTTTYLAYALPSVAFGPERARLTTDSVRRVTSGDRTAFADEIVNLLGDTHLRVELGVRARRQASAEFDWRTQSAAYVDLYNRLTANVGRPSIADNGLDSVADDVRPLGPAFDERGRRYVDLIDEVELRRFVRERTAPPMAQAGQHGRQVSSL